VGVVTVWASGAAQVSAYDIDLAASPAAAAALPGLPFAFGATAVAHSAALGEVALANSSKVLYLSDATLAQSWWDWVTDVATGDGGVFDDAVTALAYDDASGGVLYVGAPGSDGFRRFDHDAVAHVSLGALGSGESVDNEGKAVQEI
jgi:hypothetical protein